MLLLKRKTLREVLRATLYLRINKNNEAMWLNKQHFIKLRQIMLRTMTAFSKMEKV